MDSEPTSQNRIQEAVEAIIAKDNALARKLLTEEIRENPQSESAWMMMSSIITDDVQKRDCLNRVLQINPHNQQARQALTVIEHKVIPAIMENIPQEPEKPIVGQTAPFKTVEPVETYPVPWIDGIDVQKHADPTKVLGEHPIRNDEQTITIERKQYTETTSPVFGANNTPIEIGRAEPTPAPAKSQERIHRLQEAVEMDSRVTMQIALGVFAVICGMIISATGGVWLYKNGSTPTSELGVESWFTVYILPMLFMLVGVALIIFMASYLYKAFDTSLNVAELNREGRRIDGVLVRKERENKKHRHVVCQFILHPRKGGEHIFQVRQSVTEKQFSEITDNMIVTVRYLSRNPRISRIEWD